MATIKDIAKLSGYSIGTVSRVINHKADVSEKARIAIETVIKQEHFQPNSNAQYLKQTKESSVVIYVKGMGNLFLENVLEKIQIELKKYHEEADVTFVDESTNEVLLAHAYEQTRKPKGIIFLGGSSENFHKDFSLIQSPAVLVTSSAKNMDYPNLSSYYTDDYYCAQAVAQLMVKANHKNIGIIGGYFGIDQNGNIQSERLSGTIDYLKKCGIPFDLKKQYVESRFAMDSAYKATKELLEKFPEVTAIFAHSDIMAIGALRALYDMGKKVPDDVSLIGYDGISLTQFVTPRLTTIRQDGDEMAALAVHDLLYRIKYPKHHGVHEIVSSQVIEAESLRKI